MFPLLHISERYAIYLHDTLYFPLSTKGRFINQHRGFSRPILVDKSACTHTRRHTRQPRHIDVRVHLTSTLADTLLWLRYERFPHRNISCSLAIRICNQIRRTLGVCADGTRAEFWCIKIHQTIRRAVGSYCAFGLTLRSAMMRTRALGIRFQSKSTAHIRIDWRIKSWVLLSRNAFP